MISAKKAMECAQTIVEYCQQQRECQNCVFRQFGTEHWKCNISACDLQEVVANQEAKKKRGGYI